jgi:DNA-binding GntR family transcriptional regulator
MHHGAVVIEPSAADLSELYLARRRIEVAAVTEPRSAEALQPVREAFAELEAAAATGQPSEIVRTDLAFHASIVDLLASKRISAFYRQLTKELRFFVMVLSAAEGDYQRPERLVGDHRLVLEALESQNPPCAVRAVTDHLETNAARLQKILQDSDRLRADPR